jgi:hypothetical protein
MSASGHDHCGPFMLGVRSDLAEARLAVCARRALGAALVAAADGVNVKESWSRVPLLTLLVLAGCGSSPVELGVNGGSGSVVKLPRDGGGAAADAGADRAPTAGGTGGVGGRAANVGTGGTLGGGGGHGSATGGQGGSGVAEGGAGGGAVGGAAGGGTPDDPCTACEKARCAHPSGMADPGDSYSGLAAAVQVCFLGGPFPSTTASADIFCSTGYTSELAEGGDAARQPKTKLCQAFLSCVHRSNCTDEPANANEFACFCGPNVSIQTCTAPTFTPSGACATEYQNAVQSDQFASSDSFQDNICLASGAAYAINQYCDVNCCPKECLGVDPSDPNVAWDLGYCNAAGTGGTSGGSGGSPGTGGSAGTGGAVGTGGVSGTGGIVGTGGAGNGGGTGGAPGHGGTSGQAGTGGPAGAGGNASAGGAGGSPQAPLTLANGTFDSNVTGWSAGFGVTLSRSTQDAAGSSSSGSLDVAFAGGTASAAESAGWQCLSVTAGATETVRAAVLIPGQVGSRGLAALWFYASPDCSGSIASVFESPAATAGTWQTVSGAVQVPAGAGSMAVRATVYKPAGQSSAEALFDDISVSKS